jgi:hypothetical protein
MGAVLMAVSNLRIRSKDVSASASNETLDGGEAIKALSGFGACRLTKLFISAEATADVHRITLSSPNMSGGIMPIDFPVMNVAGTADGLVAIDLGPGQYLPENAEVVVGAYNADGVNACFTVVAAELTYDNPELGGQIVCYRVTPSADVTARVITTQSDVLSGKLKTEKEYYITGIHVHGEQADTVVVHGCRMIASAFKGKKPGIGGASVLPENTRSHYFWTEKDGLKNCPKIKGSDQLDIEWLTDAATKPVAYIQLFTPGK